jgi:hypothetical protein
MTYPHVRDLLTEASCALRPLLASSQPIRERCENLWAGCANAAALGAADVVFDQFRWLADDTGVTATLNSSAEGVDHILWAAMRDWCPFEEREPQ